MKKEFVSSVYLIDNQKFLLIYHQKLQKWLPPGGHVEANETPAEAARREVLEETGMEMEFFFQENLFVNCWNAKSIESPYLCLLEEVPPFRETPAHQHIDFVFVGKPTRIHSFPSEIYKWFSWEDLLNLQVDTEIFKETLQVIEHLMRVFQPASV